MFLALKKLQVRVEFLPNLNKVLCVHVHVQISADKSNIINIIPRHEDVFWSRDYSMLSVLLARLGSLVCAQPAGHVPPAGV